MLGFIQEIGPYVFDDGDLKPHPNDFSWNKEANVLFIEAPAGVGFSYCEGDVEYCSYTDEKTADENLESLHIFFTEMFTDFAKNDFYLAGESWAGVYVPYLASWIFDYNENI